MTTLAGPARGCLPRRPRRDETPLALVVDLGSSSVRAGLWRPDGTRVRGAWHEARAPLVTARPGEATIDPVALLDRVDLALDGLVAAAPRDVPRVTIATVSCFLHSLVPLDARGRPLDAIQTWADTRAAPHARVLRASLDAAESWERTGCPLAGSFWPAKLHAGLGQHPDASWAGAPELVMEHLVGIRGVARNIASATGLLDRRSLDWDGPLLDALGVPPDRLPDLIDDGAVLGRLTRHLAARWPALAETQWIAPWGDAASSNVGVGAVGSERAALNVGTSSALRALVPGTPSPLPRGLFAFRLFDRSLVGGQLAEGGGVLDWLARTLRRDRDRNRLEGDAAALPPAQHALTFLPYLAGQRGLEYRDDARGAVAGLSFATDAAALYRAAAESVAFGIADVDAALTAALDAPPAVLAGGGGMAKSALLPQLVADAIGRSVTIARAGEATSRGAALLAFHGPAAMTRASARPRGARVVEADARHFAIYADARARRRRLAERLLDD